MPVLTGHLLCVLQFVLNGVVRLPGNESGLFGRFLDGCIGIILQIGWTVQKYLPKLMP